MDGHTYANSTSEVPHKKSSLSMLMGVLLVLSLVVNLYMNMQLKKVNKQNIELKELAVQLAVEKAEMKNGMDTTNSVEPAAMPDMVDPYTQDVQGWTDTTMVEPVEPVMYPEPEPYYEESLQ